MATGFLTRTLARVRLFVDEPSTNAKYDDDSIIDLIESSWSDVFEEVNRLSSEPITVRHDIDLTNDQRVYEIPPTVGQIERLAKINSSTGLPEWEIFPRSRYNIAGPGVSIEGPTLYLAPKWAGGSVTIQMDYQPTADVRLHAGTAGTITNDTDDNNCTLVLAASPTTGSLDTQPNAYAGSVLRILTAGSNSYSRQRIITAYDHTTRTATLKPAFPTGEVPGSTVTYEIAPLIGQSLDIVVALDVAQIILGVEGDPVRAKLTAREYARKMRQARLRMANVEGIVGQHFVRDTAQSRRVLAW